MFLRLTGVVTALLLSTTLAHAEMDPYALAQQYIDQGYQQIEVKVGTSIIKIEAVKEQNRYEFTYNYQTGEMVKSETAPLEYKKSHAYSEAYSESNDDGAKSRSSYDDKSSDNGHDSHDSEDDSGSDHSGNKDSGDDD